MTLTEQKNGLAVCDGGRISPLDAARQWAAKGYFVVPIPFRQKRPVIDAWQELRLNHEDLTKHFGSAPSNIGLLLGEPYGVTDIDLDCPEALKIWQTFAPSTSCVFGHQSKPFSHWLYHMDPAGTSLKFADPIDKGTLLELRCLSNSGKIGRQTVLPGSTHKDSGEAIQFENRHDGDPSNVDAEVLIRAAKKTAAACVLARHYPPAGSGRHDCELALAGVLARTNWTEQSAKEFVVAVYLAVPSHDPKAVGRVAQSVEDSYRKISEGGEATGIPRLLALIDKRAVNAALEWLGIDGGKAASVDSTNWRDHLIVRRGEAAGCVENVLLALRNDPAWADVLHFDEFALKTVAKAQPPWPTPDKRLPFSWGDAEDVLASAWFQREGILATPETVGRSIQAYSRDFAYHPVRDYLNSLVWDGIGRIDHWLRIRLGADESKYAQAVGAKFLIGAVARVMIPGCKQDCVLILEGPQGCGKSTALRALADPWFSDELSDELGKDAAMQLGRAWILEMSELDALSRAESAKVKAFISRSTDKYRPPYGKHIIEQPRTSVIAGTTNSDAYLRDETGARRFWPVKCRSIDIEGLKRDRDQLFAEAVKRFKDNESWWLNSELSVLAAQEQEKRFDADPWHDLVAAWVEDQESVSVAEVLDHLGVMKKDWTPIMKNRVGRVLRTLGRKVERVGERGARERRYYRPCPSG